MKIRDANFALRVVRRKNGDAAIVYRRVLNYKQQERLTRIAAISPLAFSAGTPLLRSAVKATKGHKVLLTKGPFHPLNDEWGPRVACYAILAAGLKNPSRLHVAAENMRNADGAEAAWWLGLLMQTGNSRTIRALRVLTEAVK